MRRNEVSLNGHNFSFSESLERGLSNDVLSILFFLDYIPIHRLYRAQELFLSFHQNSSRNPTLVLLSWVINLVNCMGQKQKQCVCVCVFNITTHHVTYLVYDPEHDNKQSQPCIHYENNWQDQSIECGIGIDACAEERWKPRHCEPHST